MLTPEQRSTASAPAHVRTDNEATAGSRRQGTVISPHAHDNSHYSDALSAFNASLILFSVLATVCAFNSHNDYV